MTKYWAGLFNDAEEVSAPDYQRADVFFKANGEAVAIFTYPKTNWGDIDRFAVFDVDGTVVGCAALAMPKTVGKSDRAPVLHLHDFIDL